MSIAYHTILMLSTKKGSNSGGTEYIIGTAMQNVEKCSKYADNLEISRVKFTLLYYLSNFCLSPIARKMAMEGLSMLQILKTRISESDRYRPDFRDLPVLLYMTLSLKF